jgi:hypothetical protein
MKQRLLMSLSLTVLAVSAAHAEGYGAEHNYGQPGSVTTPIYAAPRPSYETAPPRMESTPPSVDSHPAGQAWDPRYRGNPGYQPGPPQHYERQYDGHYGAGGGHGPWDRP